MLHDENDYSIRTEDIFVGHKSYHGIEIKDAGTGNILLIDSNNDIYKIEDNEGTEYKSEILDLVETDDGKQFLVLRNDMQIPLKNISFIGRISRYSKPVN